MRFVRRSVERFRADPASIRRATVAIISLTVFVVTVGAVIVWIFDREEYPTFGSAIWFTLQTVTTVGYGDATPERMVGRVVAGVVMITAIGLITVVSASITSVFLEAARARADVSNRSATIEAVAQIEASMTTIADRLEALEATLAATRSESAPDRDGD